jgi:N-acetylneuraminate 9-O-acetyltransferase
VVASIVFLCYLLDGARAVPAGDKSYEYDTYVFVSIVIALICCLSVQPAHIAKGHSGILNRDQTEEWRGWMQVAFLLYHYYDAKPFYNFIRVFVASYVWQTGFGHFSYFWVRKDWSPLRFFRSMFRMNFLVVLLVLAMQTEYVHYYICPMHSLFFIFVWVLTYPFHEMNTVTWVMCTKFVLMFLFCHYLWANEGVFDAIFGVIPIFLENGSMHEWYFRSGLDRYATAFGMVFAYCYPYLERALSFIENMDILSSLSVKALVGSVSFLCLGLWYYFVGSIENKFVYNALHPYTSFIPITFFIILRNLSITFRKNYFWGLGMIGKITLETYLLQFHLMLANNNKMLVQFVDYPLLNFLITWVLLLFFSQNAFYSTDTLNNFFLPLNTPLSSIMTRLVWCSLFTAGLFGMSLILILLQFEIALYVALLGTPFAVVFCLMQRHQHFKI